MIMGKNKAHTGLKVTLKFPLLSLYMSELEGCVSSYIAIFNKIFTLE